METNSILVGVTVTLITYLFYKHFIKIYDYWSTRGVPSMEGPLPFFGNTLSIFLLRKDMQRFAEDVYEAHPNRSMVGYYQNRKPNLVLRDPDLVKTVLVTAFPNFHKNFISADPDLDPLLATNPFVVNGEEWKKRRGYLANALMSSKKLKLLCITVASVCEKFTKFIKDKARKSNGVYEVDAKELFTRFTGEVVAGVGFGVEGEFFSDESNPNSFKENIRGVFDSSLLFMLIFIAPALNKILRLRIIPKRTDRFFRSVTGKMIAERKKDGIARNDFLQLMLDAHSSKEGEIDEDDITASATSFFIDGYETSAATLQLFAYRIADNPQVQDKLRREVNDVLKEHGGVICYESIAAMTYMDQALNESMRITPAFGFFSKQCSERCKLVGNDGTECFVEAGTDVILPIESLQKDPKYWENPDVYDPERFSVERKNDRPKSVFLPFGDGPRICVGTRFAVMQMKAAVAALLKSFTIEISPKTKLPLEYTYTPLKAVEGGLWINIKPLST